MAGVGVAIGFTADDLRQAAGAKSYARGRDYVDQVTRLQISAGRVTAVVLGTGAYGVELRLDGHGPRPGALVGDCSCPYGAEGNFCKHCVATGLAAIMADREQGRDLTGAPDPDSGVRPSGNQALVSWLRSLTKDELLIELLEVITSNPEVRRQYDLRAAAQRADTAVVRAAVRELVWLDRYSDYDESGDYAGNVVRAAEAISELIAGGAAADAIELARDALSWVNRAVEFADEAAGEIMEAAGALLDVHLAACEIARPDPAALADYLAQQNLTDQYGLAPVFADYAEVLGETGTATLHERIAAAYRARPDDYQARHLMETMTAVSGDVDALVALYAEHLDPRGWQHLRIVNTLDEAGRPDAALNWAERGVRLGPRPDARLVDYVTGRYLSAGRVDDVLELRRTLFAGDRTLVNYQALRQAAIEGGSWAADREAALAALREDAAGARAAWSRYDWGGPVLVDVLADDGDLSAAWDAAQDTATEPQWLRLADLSLKDRPAAALAVYLKVIQRLAQDTGDDIYRAIAGHLASVRTCHEELGTIDEFRQYMTWLRATQKRKRNLMKILDAAGL
jgi:uncharacterized Zn finger protein